MSGPVDETWVSEATRLKLRRLTAQQAAGVLRIVRARVIEGRGVNSLLDCPGQICASTTYYGRGGKKNGWVHRADFQEAVAAAEADLRGWVEDHALGEALTQLRAGAGHAARELRRQVAGDETALDVLAGLLRDGTPAERAAAAAALGQANHAAAVGPLAAALFREKDEGARLVLIDALGKLAAAANADARIAAKEILDRVGTATAPKWGGSMDLDLSRLDPDLLRAVTDQLTGKDDEDG